MLRLAHVGLSDEGHEQARLLAEALGGVELAAVYTSPLERARQTAAEIATRHNLVPRELPGLAEIDFGELEGRRFEEIAATHPDTYATWMSRPAEVEFPGGERFADFTRRAPGRPETSAWRTRARKSRSFPTAGQSGSLSPTRSPCPHTPCSGSTSRSPD